MKRSVAGWLLANMVGCSASVLSEADWASEVPGRGDQAAAESLRLPIWAVPLEEGASWQEARFQGCSDCAIAWDTEVDTETLLSEAAANERAASSSQTGARQLAVGPAVVVVPLLVVRLFQGARVFFMALRTTAPVAAGGVIHATPDELAAVYRCRESSAAAVCEIELSELSDAPTDQDREVLRHVIENVMHEKSRELPGECQELGPDVHVASVKAYAAMTACIANDARTGRALFARPLFTLLAEPNKEEYPIDLWNKSKNREDLVVFRVAGPFSVKKFHRGLLRGAIAVPPPGLDSGRSHVEATFSMPELPLASLQAIDPATPDGPRVFSWFTRLDEVWGAVIKRLRFFKNPKPRSRLH